MRFESGRARAALHSDELLHLGELLRGGACARASDAHRLDQGRPAGDALMVKTYELSSTSVSGRSVPEAVSLCHLPRSSSYSIASLWPGTRCSAAARRAAASASRWVGNASENVPSTV